MTFTVAAALLAAFLSPISARPVCAPHDDAVAALRDRHQETRQAFGMGTGGQRLMEIYASDSGAFTVLITDVRGLACVVMVGEGWSVDTVPQGDPS